MSKIDAVVMAGGSASNLNSNVPYKGMFEIAGKPMVEWVIDALRAAPEVGKIVVTVPTKNVTGEWTEKVDQLIETKSSFSGNALAGIEASEGDHVIVCTGDIPALTPKAVSAIVTATRARKADFSYPFISQEAIQTQFPGSQRTFFKIDGGKYTAGNVAIISTAHAQAMRELGQKAFDSRKNPLKLAGIAGPSLLMQFAAGNLTSRKVEERVQEILNGRCFVFKTTEASLGADVDKPADIAVVEEILKARNLRV